MSCSTCGPAGRTITGRSKVGYAERAKNGTGGVAIYTGNPTRYSAVAPRSSVTNPSTKKMGTNTNIFLLGAVVGFVFGALVLTGTGRQIGYAAGQRVARKLY